MKTKRDHLKNLTPNVENCFWTFGGGMLEDIPQEGQGLKIKGSVMMATCETKEEVLEKLKQDVYAKEVWDLDNVSLSSLLWLSTFYFLFFRGLFLYLFFLLGFFWFELAFLYVTSRIQKGSGGLVVGEQWGIMRRRGCMYGWPMVSGV